MTQRTSAIEQVSSNEAERLHDPHESTPINQILQRISKLGLPEQEHFRGYMRHKWRLNHRSNSLRNSLKAIELFLTSCTSLGKSQLEEIVRDDLEAFVQGRFAMFHRTLPLARDASIPPQQRIAKKVNAILTHFKKSG